MLDKHYNHKDTEARFRSAWEASPASHAHPGSGQAPFALMMPPPNVTGSLHVGHALDQTLQDTLVRYQRMKGRDCLWLPGTDHASIAVHVVLERQLAEKKQTRFDLGRDAFLARAWEWKTECHANITGQLRRLGAVPDWSRERFTLDEGLNKAVTRAFVELYRKNRIYRANRLVNWDPVRQSGLSDLEVVMLPMKSHLWHIRYPLTDGSCEVVVATTRPETMLGDTAVAVNPDDPRYASLIGKTVTLPLVGRLLPIVGDSYIDKDTGTGAMKVTPAHDFNDFALGERHSLPVLNIFDKRAHLNDSVPEPYRGMERFAARKAIVADLDAQGFLVKVEPWTSNVPHDEKTKLVPIEPMLSEQWWCDQAYLAQAALKAVEDGRTVFVPKSAENTYFAWLRNIQPWCISRQLWWGHQIPAWYGPDGHVFVAETESEAQAEANRHYGASASGPAPLLTRDPDVLDTWFSSALWPFSTLGWPEATPDLARYYPGSVLVSGFDIIFFWVARMMMMGLEFMRDVPFHTVVMHGMVRDTHGQKMSKTKGNVIDPLGMIDDLGADALRAALLSLCVQGRDVRIGPPQVEKYRNFITKIWNAARYAEMNGCQPVTGFDPARLTHPLNRWMVNEVRKATAAAEEAFATFRLNDMALGLHQFVWSSFCDWYLELSKPLLTGEDGPAKEETRATLAWTLEQTLRLLHPLIPFVTEELWQHFRFSPRLLLEESWPALGTPTARDDSLSEIDSLVELISAVRSLRAELRLNPGDKIPLLIGDAQPGVAERLARHREMIERLARVENPQVTTAAPPQGSASAVLSFGTLILPLEGILDLTTERTRLNKEIAKLEEDVARVDAKLSNPDFVAKAPEDVLEEHRERRTTALEARSRLHEALKRLV